MREGGRKAVRRILSVEMEITKDCDRVLLEKQQTRICKSSRTGMGVTRVLQWLQQGRESKGDGLVS